MQGLEKVVVYSFMLNYLGGEEPRADIFLLK